MMEDYEKRNKARKWGDKGKMKERKWSGGRKGFILKHIHMYIQIF